MPTASIAMGTRIAPVTGAMGNTNPMEMMHSMLEMRNMQQQFNSNIEAGQIYVTSKDSKEAIQRMQQSPNAPWMMQTIEMQQRANEAAALAEKTRFSTGMELGNHVLRTTINDPDGASATLDNGLAGLSPEVRAEVEPYFRGIISRNLEGLPTDSPAARQAEWNKRMMSGIVGSGMPPEAYWSVANTGLPATETIGGQPTGGIRPLGGGGAITYPGVTPGSAPGGPAPTTTTGAPTTTADTDFLGKPLYTGNEPTPAQFKFSPQTGYPLLSPTQEAAASDAMKAHSPEVFNDAQQALAALDRMDGAYDNLARGGGFLKAGPSEGFRSEIAGLANVWSEIAGKEPPFDPSKIASVQEFIKETRRLTGQVTNQFFGSSRHAAQTITDMGQAVPSIENTTLAGKAIIQTIRAATQWNMDLYNFENSWLADPKHGGNLIGANAAFAATHKASDYGAKALADIGLKPGGEFANIESVAAATKKGWLTWDQGRYLAHEQFGAPLPPELKGKSWVDLEAK